MSEWATDEPGLLTLPSGRRIRGRGVRSGRPGDPPPEFGLYLLGHDPGPMPWPSRWVRWPDFWLPLHRDDLRRALLEVWQRGRDERVEIACGGGHGRTGTALACLAVHEGVPAKEAVSFVRERYNARAVETPWQRRFVHRFTPLG